MTRDLELQMARLEVKLLRARLSSHFLFNNLSAINYHILNKDPADASKYLAIFSRLLRRTLADSRSDFVALSHEIETLQLYVKMENMRFDRRIAFSVSIDRDIAPDVLQLPSLLLHTYLEKAIWRSLHLGVSLYTIKLSVSKRQGKYHIIVEDFTPEATETESRSSGLQQDSSVSLIEERMGLFNECHGTDISIETETVASLAAGPIHRVDISFAPFSLKKTSQVTHY